MDPAARAAPAAIKTVEGEPQKAKVETAEN
jgi:hypothetical protein